MIVVMSFGSQYSPLFLEKVKQTKAGSSCLCQSARPNASNKEMPIKAVQNGLHLVKCNIGVAFEAEVGL
jgi:hypothetical protein